jgi:hypothetical protein
MSSDTDTQMNEDDNEGDPVESYALVLGPLSTYPDTFYERLMEYDTAQQQAAATHEEEADVVVDDGDEDGNSNDSDSTIDKQTGF